MEAAEKVEVKRGPKGWTDRDKFMREFVINSMMQRLPKVAIQDANDAYRTIMDMNIDEPQRKFMLEAIARSSGSAAGVGGLVRTAQGYWKALNGS